MAAPCSWNIADSIGCCSDFWAELTAQEQAAATQAATFVLWAATGRQYGVCEQTVRPCGRWPCDDGIAGYTWSNGVFVPYVLDGQWFNCACGAFCTCGARCRVYLPGPVASVTSVVVDASVVAASAYRVDDARWLIRTDGGCWPDSQDFDVDSGDDTFLVTYGRGTVVPPYLLAAAGTYACEWARMCRGEACAIPTRVVTLTRQGTTFDGVDIDQLLARGLTGVASVDQVIVMANPHRLTGRLRILSPEVTGPFQTTIP
jgi:hypothetical protein